MANQHHQPFDEDPELFEDDPEMQGGTTHGQDEADDLSALLDDEKGPGGAAPNAPHTDGSPRRRPPDDENR